MCTDFEAAQMDTLSLDFQVVVGGQRYKFTDEFNGRVTVSDAKGMILENSVVPKQHRASSGHWSLYVVNGTNRNRLDDETKRLMDYRRCWTCLTTTPAHLELVKEVNPDKDGVQKLVVENSFPLMIEIVPPDGSSVAKLTMDVNVTLPASSVIENIFQHGNVPRHLRSMIGRWTLAIVSRSEILWIPEEVPINCIGGNVNFSGGVHLRLAISQNGGDTG